MFLIFALIIALMRNPETNDTTSNRTYVVVYNIQDLEFVVQNFGNAPEMDLNNVLSNRGSNPFTNTSNQNNRQQKNPRELMNLIQSVVEPEVWGDTATMNYWNGNIVVKAPKRIHDQIK